MFKFLGRSWASPTLAWLHCSRACVCMTALRTCVCMYVCMFVCGHIPKILIELGVRCVVCGVWCVVCGVWSLNARVQRSLPGVEMTEVEVHMATYSLFATDYRRQVAHRQYKSDHDGGRGRFRWGPSRHKRHGINVRNAAYDFSVKLSSCICSHTDSSCPGCWLMWYVDIYLCVTNPALCNNKLVSVLLAQARSTLIY